MDHPEVIRRCREIVAEAGVKSDSLGLTTALDFFETVKDIVKAWPRVRIETTPWLQDFAESLRALRDDFEAIVRADPACLYFPAHAVALAFHQSISRVRYYYGGNRISKTQSAYIDDYWIATGQHPYRPRPPLPSSVFIVGTNYTKYAPNTFESKWVTGEGGNMLSPLLPDGGKWFNHYDDRKKLLKISCPECAAKGKPKDCKHPKSTIVLFSDQQGAGPLAGAQYAQGHLDEQVQREFFSEGMERLKTVPNSGLIITETPLFGKAWWTYQDIYTLGHDPLRNNIPGTNRTIVSLHTISQYDAGLVAKEQIDISAAAYTEVEKLARIYGQHVVDSEHTVFDPVVLSKMRDQTETPERGLLSLERELVGELVEDLVRSEVKATDLRFQPDGTAGLRVWEKPDLECQYIIGVDVAKGLTKRDASCASVFKVDLEGSFFRFKLVAQYHGWINPEPYAEILFKLGLWYGACPIVIERNGPGDSVIYQMVNRLHCWFLLRDIQNPAMMRLGMNTLYGVDTNVATKGMMIGFLQQAIKDRSTGVTNIEIPDQDTLSELESYIQEPSDSGHSFKFKGLGSSHDDRVMSCAVAVYAVKTFPDAFSIDRANESRIRRHSSSSGDASTKSFWKAVRADLDQSNKRDPLDP